VLNSFSFPFSTLPNPRVKPGLLQQVKQILTQVSAVRNVTVKLCL
jgi:RAD51-like protein 2